MIAQTSLFDSPKPARPDLAIGDLVLIPGTFNAGRIVSLGHRSAIVQWRERSASGEFVRRSTAMSFPAVQQWRRVMK